MACKTLSQDVAPIDRMPIKVLTKSRGLKTLLWFAKFLWCLACNTSCWGQIIQTIPPLWWPVTGQALISLVFTQPTGDATVSGTPTHKLLQKKVRWGTWQDATVSRRHSEMSCWNIHIRACSSVIRISIAPYFIINHKTKIWNLTRPTSCTLTSAFLSSMKQKETENRKTGKQKETKKKEPANRKIRKKQKETENRKKLKTQKKMKTKRNWKLKNWKQKETENKKKLKTQKNALSTCFWQRRHWLPLMHGCV